MPTQARKTTPRKPSPAVAARREVRGEKNKPATLHVKFRGETFQVTRDRLGSARVVLRQRHIGQFGVTVDSLSSLLFEILGEKDSARFIDLCGPGDSLLSTSSEFMNQLNKAANVPNS